MLQEIKTRINQIVEGITGLSTGKTIKGMAHLPDTLISLPLPLFLLGTESIPYILTSSNLYQSDIRLKWYLFIREVGTGSSPQADTEPFLLIDKLATEFLSRPHLDFGGDTGLTNVDSPLTFSVNGDTARPIAYPIGVSNAKTYWTITGNLIIPYTQKIELATT